MLGLYAAGRAGLTHLAPYRRVGGGMIDESDKVLGASHIILDVV